MTEEISAEIRYLKARYDQAPESRLFAPLADAYRKNGQVDRAIELCEAGLTRYPDYASAHVILGKCFYDKGATERSRAEFERVIELDAENMVALKFMGDILLAEGKREEALSYLRRLLAIDPTNEEAAAVIGGLEDEFQGREIDLGRTPRTNGGGRPDEVATMTLAGIYAAQGYYTKALKIYREISRTQPDNEEAKRMIDKIEELVNSSDRERGEAFDEDVMTISIDDVSDELTESTSGSGTGGTRAVPGRPPAERPVDEEPFPVPPPSDEDELEQVARELETADRMDSAGDDGERDAESVRESGGIAGAAREGMDNFRRWLEKIQNGDAGGQGDDR